MGGTASVGEGREEGRETGRVSSLQARMERRLKPERRRVLFEISQFVIHAGVERRA